MKYILDQNLIKQLQEGKIAINYGDSKMPDKLEKLRAVLQEAFPLDAFKAHGDCSFYLKGEEPGWTSYTEGSFPSILLDNFIFEPGDTLYEKDGSKHYFVGFDSENRCILQLNFSCSLLSELKGMMVQYSKLSPKTRLTKQQIADKFGISVEGLEIV